MHRKFILEFYGNTPVDKLSLQQKFFRPVKKWAVKFGLVPKTSEGKKIIKRLIFGRLVKIPHEIDEELMPYVEPEKIPSTEPDRKFKVIYCAATLSKD